MIILMTRALITHFKRNACEFGVEIRGFTSEDSCVGCTLSIYLDLSLGLSITSLDLISFEMGYYTGVFRCKSSYLYPELTGGITATSPPAWITTSPSSSTSTYCTLSIYLDLSLGLSITSLDLISFEMGY
jgi:hypothetical protein